jgi:hypothetical protein
MWGGNGTGKTTLAIRFPNVVIIDLEDGTAHYGGVFDFDVRKVTTADETMQLVDWLLTHPHQYRTLVIDPITLYWEALVSKHNRILMQRNKGGKGHHGEYYEMQARDWVIPKAEFKDFLRKLIALDMNVIVTAREKTQYADAGFMRVSGETFDCEKSLPYIFDTILRLYRDENGRFMAENIKDRTNKLPRSHFPVNYSVFEQCLGGDTLTREAAILRLATPEQINQIRHFADASGIRDETLRARLTVYGATSLETLTLESAQFIIEKLAAAAAGRPPADPMSK